MVITTRRCPFVAAGLGVVNVEIRQLRRAAAEARRQLRELLPFILVEGARVSYQPERGVVEVPRCVVVG